MTALQQRKTSASERTAWLLTDWPVVAAGLDAMLRADSAPWLTRLFISSPEMAAVADSSADFPDAVIADPRLLSPELLALLTRESIPVVALTLHPLPAAMTAGYKASVSPADTASDICNTLGAVTATPETTPSAAETTPSGNDLSPREREVVCAIVKGLSNKEIASEMNVSVNTIMTHRRNIASKLRLHSPAALTIYALASGLVSLDDVKDAVM